MPRSVSDQQGKVTVSDRCGSRAIQCSIIDNSRRNGCIALGHYLRESASAVEDCVVEYQDSSRNAHGKYLVRWKMMIRFRKFARGKETWSIGISHLRLARGLSPGLLERRRRRLSAHSTAGLDDPRHQKTILIALPLCFRVRGWRSMGFQTTTRPHLVHLRSGLRSALDASRIGLSLE